MNETPSAMRTHIAFFGLRNAGKSSLINRIAHQDVSLVSDIKGTTTDPVRKSMEILPIGPVVLIDTPGFDDEGALGDKRVARTKEELAACDVAVLVTENDVLLPEEEELRALILARKIPFLTARNKADLISAKEKASVDDASVIKVSALTGDGIDEFLEKLIALAPLLKGERPFITDLINEGDMIVLVVPIDASAPKGRLILPQQRAAREILDAGAAAVMTTPEGLSGVLDCIRKKPDLVITDSQAFAFVKDTLPADMPLTSFSILMARSKGFLSAAVRGADAVCTLEDGDVILISEGCTHHRQCEDIGTVKIPAWLKSYTGKDLKFRFTSGKDFPEDLSGVSLVVHCGACMLTDAQVALRMQSAVQQGVPFTNYGTVIAKMNGILERSLAPLGGALQ